MRKIKFGLIPQNMWYCNLRHLLSKKDWDIIRKKAYSLANGKCMICERKVKRLEAHELWEFDENTKAQKLKDIIAICPLCHMTIHIGHSELIGKGPICLKHYCDVNKCSKEECIKDYKEEIKLWEHRNTINWNLDISYLDKFMKK